MPKKKKIIDMDKSIRKKEQCIFCKMYIYRGTCNSTESRESKIINFKMIHWVNHCKQVTSAWIYSAKKTTLSNQQVAIF